MPDATLPPPLRLARATPTRRSRAAPTPTRAPSARGRAACGRPRDRSRPRRSRAYARAGIGWLATDEGNLWRSLALTGEPHGRGDLYRAWRHARRRRGVSRSRALATGSASPTRTATRTPGVADLLARARARARRSRRRRRTSRRWCPSSSTARTRGRPIPASASRSCARCSPRSRRDARAARRPSIGQHLDARAGAPHAVAPALGLVDRLRLPHLDRRPGQEPRLGAARPRARALRSRRRRGRRRRVEREAAFERLLAAEGSRLVLVVRRAVPLDGGRALRRAVPRAPRRRLRSRSACRRRASSTSRWPRTPAARRRRRHARPTRFIRPHDRRQPLLRLAGRRPLSRAARRRHGRHAARRRHPLRLRSARRSTCASSRPTVAPPSSPRRASRSRSPSAQRRVVLSSATGERHDRRRRRAAAPRVHGRTVELAAPFASLGRAARRSTAARPCASSRGDAPLARYPADGALALTVPGDGFEAENWSA